MNQYFQSCFPKMNYIEKFKLKTLFLIDILLKATLE